MEQLNYIPTPHDAEYNTFKGFNVGLTSTASNKNVIQHIIPEYTPISNQLTTESCVANATADALEILMGLNNINSVKQLSRLFIYYNARTLGGNSDVDGGCFIHNAFKSLSTLGVCSEDLWPFEQNNIFKQPSIFAYKQAYDNRITGAYRITSSGDSRLDDIVMSLDLNTPVVFGTGVSEEFLNAFGVDKVWTMPEKTLGNHAMIITGYKKESGLKFYVRNSWGEEWGINGHCWFDSSYIKNQFTNDIWVATYMDSLLID